MIDNFDKVTEFLKNGITEKKTKSVLQQDLGLFLSVLYKKSKNKEEVEFFDFVSRKENLNFEYVYIFKGAYKGVTRYKIGKAQDITDRKKIFSVKLPFDIELAASFRVKDALKLESEMHKTFKAFRAGGEWFDLNQMTFDAVCQTGMAKEAADLGAFFREAANQLKKQNEMNDQDYIDHLESLLVMNGISFSREVNNGA